MKPTEKLFDMIPKLKPIEFLGLARLLGVKVIEDKLGEDGKPVPRLFSYVLEDVLQTFDKLSRKRKREIIRMMKDITKGDEKCQ